MKNNKLEDSFKSKLSNREIPPSAKSWEQLRSRLDSNDKKKTPMIWWMGLAASFLAGIVVMGFFFNSSMNEEPRIVTVENNEFQNELVISPDQTTPPVELVENSGKKGIITEPLKEVSAQNPEKVFRKKNQNTNALLPVIKPNENENTDLAILPEISEKTNKSLATVQPLKNQEPEILVSEIDMLLDQAGKQIQLEKREAETKLAVNRKILLKSIETELHQSFRDKIFEMLKDGFLKTKNIVATKID